MKKKNDLSFEIGSESEDSEIICDEESTESKKIHYNTCKSKNVKSSINLNKDECFIVFWECLSKLLMNVMYVGQKYYHTTLCEKNYTFQ